jgi:uncharacterized membrane protein
MSLAVLWLHVLGVVVWLGGLMYQAHVLMPAARRGDVVGFAEAARRGRPAAWTALAVVVLTGFYNVTQLGPLQQVMASGAGLLLAGKFLLVVALLPLMANRDFTQVRRLAAAPAASDESRAALRLITWLDRLVLALGVAIVWLGLAVSRR